MLLLATFSAPFFSIGDVGFAGVALVDLLVLAGCLVLLFRMVVESSIVVDFRKSISVISVGLLFSAVGWFSVVGAPSGFDAWDFSVVLAQYFFLMVVLPVVASAWINLKNIDKFFFWVGIVYLVPMLLSLTAVVLDLAFLREIFFSAERAIGTYGNANVYAAIVVLVLPIYVSFLLRKGGRRIIGGVGVSLALINLTLTASYGGVMLVVLVTLFAVIWAALHGRLRRFAVKAVAIVSVLVAGIAFLLSYGGESDLLEGRVIERIEHVVDDGVGVEQLGSASVRLGLIFEGWQWVVASNGAPLGHGLGQSWRMSEYGQNIHMLYLLLWVEGGIVLLLVYVAFLCFLFRNAIQLAKINFEAGTLVVMGLFVILCFGFLNPHMYLRFFWWPVLPAFFSWQELQK